MNVWVNYHVGKNNPDGSATIVGVYTDRGLSTFRATQFKAMLHQTHIEVEFDEKPYGFGYVAKGLKSTGEDIEVQGFYGWRERPLDL